VYSLHLNGAERPVIGTAAGVLGEACLAGRRDRVNW